MKMTDRIFPGAGVNSFLQYNGILKGLGEGEVKRIDEVASVSEREKSQLYNPNITVPVTTNDLIDNSNTQGTGANGILSMSEGANRLNGTTSASTSPTPSAYSTSSAVETYCPFCKNDSEKKKEMFSGIKEVWDRFSSNDKNCPCRRGRKGRTVKGYGEVITKADDIADKLKTTLTGAGKDDKNVIEQFCDEHWHGVATSIVVVIAIIFITLAVMIYLMFIKKLCCCCGKKKYTPISLEGGTVF